jgi:hypothetical protein
MFTFAEAPNLYKVIADNTGASTVFNTVCLRDHIMITLGATGMALVPN